jgi:hypothetical protein
MTVLTGADGELLYGTTRVAKVRDWSLTVNKDAIEDTCLGNYDRTYVEGLRGTTGSATILYDPSKSTTNALLNTIFATEDKTQTLTFKMNRNGFTDGGGTFVCSGFLTSVSPSVSVGSAQAVSVTFQVSGAVNGGF